MAKTTVAKSKKGAVQSLVRVAKTAATAAAARAEELLALIARRKRRISEDFFEIGVALQELKKRKLFVAIGFASFAEMLKARAVMSARAAEKLVDIVAAMKRDQALELGPEKAYALARLVAATPEPDSVAEVVAKGAVVRGKKVAVGALSTREIAEVARAARPKRATAETKQADAAAKALRQAVRARGAKHAVVTIEKRKGALWITFEAPLAEAHRVLAGAR